MNPPQSAIENNGLQVRIYGDASLATLIYLPGIHGDWTLVAGFRKAIGHRVRFVEFTYPRTTTFSLNDYAQSVEIALKENGIERGWLLGESFGSQIVWPLLERQNFQVEGIIFAGGFGRHPALWTVRLAQQLTRPISYRALKPFFALYQLFARIRYRNNPIMQDAVREFVAWRSEASLRAAKHRLKLILQCDPSAVAQQIKVPMFSITGFLDPIVPWFGAGRWFKENCPAFQESKTFWPADHHVLGTAPAKSAEQILKWMQQYRAHPLVPHHAL
jgi:pimeloyl-ACP methyl ester carboxylesterase